MKSTAFVFLAVVVIASLLPLVTQGDDENRPEAGRVNWIRDYESGWKQVTAEKPMLLLFQEIPG